MAVLQSALQLSFLTCEGLSVAIGTGSNAKELDLHVPVPRGARSTYLVGLPR